MIRLEVSYIKDLIGTKNGYRVKFNILSNDVYKDMMLIEDITVQVNEKYTLEEVKQEIKKLLRG